MLSTEGTSKAVTQFASAATLAQIARTSKPIQEAVIPPIVADWQTKFGLSQQDALELKQCLETAGQKPELGTQLIEGFLNRKFSHLKRIIIASQAQFKILQEVEALCSSIQVAGNESVSPEEYLRIPKSKQALLTQVIQALKTLEMVIQQNPPWPDSWYSSGEGQAYHFQIRSEGRPNKPSLKIDLMLSHPRLELGYTSIYWRSPDCLLTLGVDANNVRIELVFRSTENNGQGQYFVIQVPIGAVQSFYTHFQELMKPLLENLAEPSRANFDILAKPHIPFADEDPR